MAIGALQVMAEREAAVDFSVPFYDMVGTTILMKLPSVATSLFKFLSVLDDTVWGCIVAAYFVTRLRPLRMAVKVQCDQKKSPNVYKSSLKMISLEKMIDFNTFTKLPKNEGDLGKINGYQRLLKVVQSQINRPIWLNCTLFIV